MIAALAACAAIAAAMLSFWPIDRSVVLRFLAPTAFETRSIEEILEGGSR